MSKRVLHITPVPLFPEYGGNRQRIAAVCRELMNHGYTIDLFNCGFSEFNDRHREFLNGELLESGSADGRVEGGGWPRFLELMNGVQSKMIRLWRKATEDSDSFRYNQSLHHYKNISKREQLRRQVAGRDYHAVIVNYAVYSHFFDLFPDSVIKIIDTHDRLTDRYRMFLENNLEPIKWKSLTEKSEGKALKRADRIWAITEKERAYFETLIDNSFVEVITVSHLADFTPIPGSDEKSGKNLLLVSGSSEINVDGLRWFLKEVWPGVVSARADAGLIIAGSICDRKDEFKEIESIQFIGRYDDEKNIYNLSDLCINPMRFGTGLKIKTLEALSHQKIVLTTMEGASGLERFNGKGMICSDDAAIWIEQITNYLSDSLPPPDGFNSLKQEFADMRKDTVSSLLNSLQ